MPTVSAEHLVNAVHRVQAMTIHEREVLADEIHAVQPNLLYSVLVLQRFGATIEQLEVVLTLLLELHEAAKESGHRWPLIEEVVQERCLARLTARMRFVEGLGPEQTARAVTQALDAHPEPVLLAHVYDTLARCGVLGVRTQAEKYLILAALNLVECMAEAAPGSDVGSRPS